MHKIDKVVVFVDYQNAHHGALRAFWPANTSPSLGHINPRGLGELLVTKRAANGLPSDLADVRVYRGQPDAELQPESSSANNQQADSWSRLGKVTVIRRPLRYPRKWPVEPAQEKGVDVQLAVDFVRLAIEKADDVGVLVIRICCPPSRRLFSLEPLTSRSPPASEGRDCDSPASGCGGMS